MCSPMMLTRPGARHVRVLSESIDRVAQLSHPAVGEYHRDHVEAQRAGAPTLALQVLEGELAEPPALVERHGLFREAELRGRPCLHLAEHEDTVPLADDVELASATAVVPVEDRVALVDQRRG